MAYRSPFFQPRQDTGWGLIYRLNLLLGKIETDVENGDIENWNKHIDSVFRNILYRNPEEIIKDEQGHIEDIRFSQEDIKVFSMFAKKIKEIKEGFNKLGDYDNEEYKKKKRQELEEKYYNLVFKKDIWIRKKMFAFDLYLKQIEHDARRAIYGG
jgi:hypothetical protein